MVYYPHRAANRPSLSAAAPGAYGPGAGGFASGASKTGRMRINDGFDNVAAHLGLSQDNLLAASGYRPGQYATWNRTRLTDMYRTSWVVARAVEVVAEDMVRSGIDLQTTMDEGDKSLLLKSYRRSGNPGRLTDAIKWGRLYGGAMAVMLIDGHDPVMPLELSSIGIGQYKGLHVLDRHQVTPSNELISELGPMLGYPKYYTINTPEQSGLHVHHSRVLRFIGVDLPDDARRAEQFWGASVVERIYDRILALDSATYGAANLMYRSFLRVIGIKRLREILAAGGKSEQALIKMIRFMREMQSNESLTIIDEEDKFNTYNWTFAGVYEGLQAFSEQISGGTGIPLIRLLGQSSKGFSSGDSDLRTYYDGILTQIDDDLRSPQETLLNVQSYSLWGRPLPEDFNFEYLSLFVPTENEKSAVATADAQNVAGLQSIGIISKAQALAELKARSRITGRFSAISDQDIQAAEEEDAAPPLPEGMPGGPDNGSKDMPEGLLPKVADGLDDAEFKEADHPRGPDGKFGAGGGSGGQEKAESYQGKQGLDKLLGVEHTGVKGQAAINKVLEAQGGHVKGAFERADIGKIDLAWGDDSFGLKHIMQRRTEQGIDARQFISTLTQVVEKGKLKLNERGHYELRHKDSVAIVTPEFRNGKTTMLLTAYKK